MSDETDTTSEAARVLGEHSHYAPDASERGDLAGANWECADCAHALGVSFDDDPTSAMAAHQAAMLAEAGLLAEEDTGTELLTREREDTLRDLHARYHDEVGNLLGRDECGWDGCEYWDAAQVTMEELDRAGLLVPQIAAQEPAGATQGGSGDSRTSGGLDGAPVDPLDVSELLSQVARLEQERDRLENEVHGLEQAKDQWRDSANVAEAQVEAIRAAITREAAHGEAITRCNLVAERFQTVLDSVSAP